MELGLRQDNAEAMTRQLYETIKEAAKWYDEFLNEDTK
jgi:hypothetical protein